MSITFTVPGKPVGKARARVIFDPRGAHSYTPEDTVLWENAIKMFAREAGVDLTEKLVGVDVVIKKAPAKSWSKKKVAESKKRWYMKSKPDIDNVIKSCLDGLNGVAWRDDDQVASVSASRVIADRDATVITIRLLE